jgi:hypothetical protein
VEEGNYDDDHPFLGIFYTGLNAYIEDTISIYNSITEADIENVLNRINATRAAVTSVPVTEVGKYSGFEIDKNNSKDDILLPVSWDQNNSDNTMYNNIIMDVKRPPDGYYYVAGCGPVAIAQIMAFHSKKMIDAGKPAPYLRSQAPGYTDVKYDWPAMIDEIDEKAIRAIGVLMYEIGLPCNANSTYTIGAEDKINDKKKKGQASAGTYDYNVKIAFRNMGYKDPGNFAAYKFSGVKSSINKEEPVMAAGYEKEITTTYIFGITYKTHEVGHFWVVDGYRRMITKAKYDKNEPAVDYPADYVHCNLGWGGSKNGWYFDGVFNTDINDIPLPDRSSISGFFQYKIRMLTGIRPK